MKTLAKISMGLPIVLLAVLPVNGWSQCDDPVHVDLGRDTVICQNGALILDAGEAGTYLWQDKSTDRYLSVTSPGLYYVTASNGCSSDRDTILIRLVVPPDFTLKVPDKNYFCKGERVSVEPDGLSPITDFFLEWSVDSTGTIGSPFIVIDSTSDVTLMVKDLHGCKKSKNIKVDFQFPYEHEQILLATYDTVADRNMVIWSRTPGKRTDRYDIIRGLSRDNLMGEVPFGASTMMIDEQTDPNVAPAYYNLSLKDSCNNASTLNAEKGHRTMFLQTEINADGQIVLRWNRYLGFDYDFFYIFRGTDENPPVLIDSVSNNRQQDEMSYTDLSARAGMNYRYQVGVKAPQPVYYEIADRKKAKRRTICLFTFQPGRQ